MDGSLYGNYSTTSFDSIGGSRSSRDEDEERRREARAAAAARAMEDGSGGNSARRDGTDGCKSGTQARFTTADGYSERARAHGKGTERARKHLFGDADEASRCRLAASRRPITLDFDNVRYTVTTKLPSAPAATNEDADAGEDAEAEAAGRARRWRRQLQARGQRYVVRPLRSCFIGSAGTTTTEILHGVTGAARPGELLAILGPSGSGKTTLLNALAGRSELPISDGSILFNHQPRTSATRRVIGYVLQDDVFLANLTVGDTLQFTADVRLPRTMSRGEKKQRVEEVLQFLNLGKARDTIIGDQQFNKGISGGERKRCNIAETLLLNPSLLLLDEPTSGLDATTALSVARMLKDLAVTEGRTVVTTIHQPSSQIYSEFDKLLLLSEGYTVFYGPASDAVPYFAEHGFETPYGYNPADYFSDLLVDDERSNAVDQKRLADVPAAVRQAVEQRYGASEEEREQRGVRLTAAKVLQEAWRVNAAEMLERDWRTYGEKMRENSAVYRAAAQTNRGLPEPAQHGAEVKRQTGIVLNALSCGALGRGRRPRGSSHASDESSTSAAAANADADADADVAECAGEQAPPVQRHKYAVSWLTQFRALAKRAIQQRAGQLFVWSILIQVLVLSLLVGLVWFQSPAQETNVQQRLGIIFFSAVFFSFFSLFQSLTSFPSERAILRKDRSAGSYNLSSYFMAKTTVEAPLELVYPIMYSLIAYWMAGLKATAGAFFLWLVTISFLTLVAQSFGYLVSAIVMDFRKAQVIASIWMLASMLTAGFYITTDQIPVFIRWIKWLSFVFYGYTALAINEFRGREFACVPGSDSPYSPPCPVTAEQIYAGADITTLFGVGGSIGMLILLLVVFRLAAYLVLRWLQGVRK